jgi:hypothetical protein
MPPSDLEPEAQQPAEPTRRGTGPHAYQKGQSGNPAGRPVGSKNRFLISQAQAIARAGKNPLEILLAYATRDPAALERCGIDPREATPAVARWALTAALPYTNKRMPVAVEMDVAVSQGGGTTFSPEVIRFLSDEELAFLVRIMDRGQEIQRRLQNNEPTIDDPASGKRVFFLDVATEATQAAISAAAASS